VHAIKLTISIILTSKKSIFQFDDQGLPGDSQFFTRNTPMKGRESFVLYSILNILQLLKVCWNWVF